ncbi:MAG: DUF3108 domain-containing protein [Clostridium sp.]|nr:DUF3108 domain-containing protein [Clostridium sp.]
MKKTIAILLACIAALAWAHAAEFSPETLKYKVMYKWGLINKKAGDVTITLASRNDIYDAELTAKTASWADKFYKVRDTLRSEIVKEGLKPLVYEKLAHESKDYNQDKVVYLRQGADVYGECTHKWFREGKLKRQQDTTLVAQGTTIDMLTAFYFMRTLPYETLSQGHVETVNIFSGKRKELLTIKYLGKEDVKTDGKTYPCFKVAFIFTSDGKKKSSDDMFAWITTDPKRLPVKLEGKLPVGSVKCFLEE